MASQQVDMFGYQRPRPVALDARGPLVVSFGAGVNSVAMLVGMAERGERPDAIVFSDTRGEKPETYTYLREVLPPWLASVGFPALTVVCRADFPNSKTGDESLEAECLRLGTLPSRAYGFGTCADKWKIDPFKWWAKSWPVAIEAWAAGEPVIRCIGYDAGEERRVGAATDKGFTKRFPLLEWGWDRADCIAAIARAGLPLPPKSACFYCPASTKPEIIQLGQRHPALAGRAVGMETRAIATGRWAVAGLGRRFAWGALLAADDAARALFEEAPVAYVRRRHGGLKCSPPRTPGRAGRTDMRTWTETHREGTDCGPVDWTHPMVATAVERARVPVETLREMAAHPEQFQVTNDGGWPRCGWRPVLSVSMYDGWPYWTPGPAVLVAGVLGGGEWYWFDTLTGVERKRVLTPNPGGRRGSRAAGEHVHRRRAKPPAPRFRRAGTAAALTDGEPRMNDTDKAREAARLAIELAGKATPGPWFPTFAPWADGRDAWDVGDYAVEDSILAGCTDERLAAFIAAARTTVPTLAGHVEALANEVDRLRALVCDGCRLNWPLDDGVHFGPDSKFACRALGAPNGR